MSELASVNFEADESEKSRKSQDIARLKAIAIRKLADTHRIQAHNEFRVLS